MKIKAAVLALAALAGLWAAALGFQELADLPAGVTGWRWTFKYFKLFMVLMLVLAVLGRWLNTRRAWLAALAGLAVGLGVAGPAAGAGFIALSALATGRALFRDPGLSPMDALLAGLVVWGAFISLLVHWPINQAGIYAVLFTLPLAWRHLRSWWLESRSVLASRGPAGAHLFWLECAIGAVSLLHFLVALMPEIGTDALFMHLLAPARVEYFREWTFDVSRYSWAVMPMLADWLYTAGYLLAGETGARLLNVGGCWALAALVRRGALWAGADSIGAGWAALLLLTTPLSFLASSSLFVENMWAAFLLGGLLAALRPLASPGRAKTDFVLAGLLLGGAAAAKMIAFCALPGLTLVWLAAGRSRFRRGSGRSLAFGTLVFIAVGAVPYLRAWLLTGNPVFPFFNAFFKSPLFPLENAGQAMWGKGLAWDTLYRLTFESGRFLEATPGAAGFQWLPLMVPLAVALLLAWPARRRALALALVGLTFACLVFSQVAYLRYIYPAVALECLLAGPGLSLAASAGRLVYGGAALVAALAVALNLLHFHTGGWYGHINFRVIVDSKARDDHLAQTVPGRAAVNLVNELNPDRRGVLFMAPPQAAGLKGDPYLYFYDNSPLFYGTAEAICQKPGGAEEFRRYLAGKGVEWMIVDSSKGGNACLSAAGQVSEKAAGIGTSSLSVRAVKSAPAAGSLAPENLE